MWDAEQQIRVRPLRVGGSATVMPARMCCILKNLFKIDENPTTACREVGDGAEIASIVNLDNREFQLANTLYPSGSISYFSKAAKSR